MAGQSHGRLFNFLVFPAIGEVFDVGKLDSEASGGVELQGTITIADGALVVFYWLYE